MRPPKCVMLPMKKDRSRSSQKVWLMGLVVIVAFCAVGATTEFQHLEIEGAALGSGVGLFSGGLMSFGEVVRRRKQVATNWLQPVGALSLLGLRFSPALDHVFGFAASLAFGLVAAVGLALIVRAPRRTVPGR